MNSTATLPARLAAHAPTPTAPALPKGWLGGKYREIVVAVALFLLFDLGVLVLNFYTSFRIAEDAVGINLSGRQRMLSQRTAKALFSLEAAVQNQGPRDQDATELRKATELFQATLNAFQRGGTVPGGDGQPVVLPASTDATAQAILERAQALWTPYHALLGPVISGQATGAELRAAVQYARANNVALLGLMNDLTTALEGVASSRANTLRTVQTVGIVLALLNFAFILFKFLRRLRASDAAIETANEENREILSSVREGLFLITPSFRLGSQVSASTQTLFGRALNPGDSLFDLLTPIISPQVLADARGYVELLFAPHIKEALVQDINPLQEVKVYGTNRLGQSEERFLSFHFNRVLDNGQVRHLLVTVQDITQRMALQDRLNSERTRSQREFDLLLKAFETDPGLLRQFVDRAQASLLDINERLRDTAHTHGNGPILQALEAAWRRLHALKGDAASLGLQSFSEQVHAFESELVRIRESGGADEALGQALLGLPVHLEDLLGKVATLKRLAQRQAGAAPQDGAGLAAALQQLAQTVARDTGKRAVVSADLHRLADLDRGQQALVRDVAIQLVRNAVAHGIEPPSVRQAAGKDGQGRVDVVLTREQDEWQLRVCDDGAGLNAADIAQRLLEKRWYSPEQLSGLSDQQIVAHIFKAGFSTAEAQGLHAGRGVGLDLVQSHVRQLGARLLLRTTGGRFTEFRIRFGA